MSSRVLDELRSGERRPVVLVAALAMSGLAALLFVAGALVPVVDGAERGYAGEPLLVILAVLPVVVAGAFALRGNASLASGVLAGVAALAPGRAMLDLQFAVDPSLTARPELYLPSDLLEHSAAAGLWFLVAGHVATALSGVLALSAHGEVADRDVDQDAVEQERAARWRQRWLLVVVVAAVVTAVGLVMAPFGSDDVYLLVRNAFEGPAVALTGYLLLAAALPLGAALAVSAGSRDLARGCLVGLAVAAAAVAVPALTAGLSLESATIGAGPVVALVGMVGLVAVAGTRSGAAESAAGPDEAGEAKVPGRARLLAGTGGLAVVTSVLAFLGAFTDQLSTAGSVPAPDSPARWLLLSAGVLVGVLGVAMFVPGLALRARPVLSVAWAGVLMAGTAVLDTAVTATSVAGGLVSPGPGVVWTWLAMIAAGVTACCAVVAGIVEREDAGERDDEDDDMAGEGRSGVPPLGLLIPLVAAGVLAVAAFGTPVVVAPDYVAAGLWSDFGTPSWGLLAGLLTVLGALALVPRSRPGAAAGLLFGVVCLMGLHAATLPLTGGDIEGAGAGVGFWLALAAIVAVLVAAAFVMARVMARGARPRRRGAP